MKLSKYLLTIILLPVLYCIFSFIDGRGKVINGILVPPMPNFILNSLTISGIDSNNNGVRDDIEREVAKISKNYNEYIAIMAVQKTKEELIGGADSTYIKNSMFYNSCKFTKSDTPPEISELTLNTQDRTRNFMKNMKKIGGLMTPEISPCPGVSNDL